MRILILAHSFNSLSQRLYIELKQQGHELSVELDINDETTIEAVRLFEPDLVVAPILKRRIPDVVWKKYRCLIVHPGIPGDGGKNSLDWAILEGRKTWGVTVLQATGELDGGPVWSWCPFPVRRAAKSSLYRAELTDATVAAVTEALNKISRGDSPKQPTEMWLREIGSWRDGVKAKDRVVDWLLDDTDSVLRRIHSADGHPGVKLIIEGLACRAYDAHEETRLKGTPGELIVKREGAVCVATRDGAVWIGHLKIEEPDAFKLPAATVLGERIRNVAEISLPPTTIIRGKTWQDIRYREADKIGYLYFDFYNGAMSTRQCRRLQYAFEYAATRPTRVIVFKGGREFWSNGLDLNAIEAAPSAADESWRNINAMDDLCEAIIRTTTHITVAALGANAGAGGCYLALATDLVMARDGIVLNPHYRNMGNLYGSEFWSYLLPGRVRKDKVREVTEHRLPMGAREAARLGFIDWIGHENRAAFDEEVEFRARQIVGDYEGLISDKQLQRESDETSKPLDEYRKEELEKMRLNFYGFDPSYHVARHRFVHHTPHAWTPLYLARHRQPEPAV
jgi:putative two-component system hydrogenase maturation factor HypX/HoxX